MPRLRTYVEVGICSGYGDGDYRIHLADVENLSIHDMNELRRAFCVAIAQTERYWMEAQMKKPENQAAQAQEAPTLLGDCSAAQQEGKTE